MRPVIKHQPVGRILLLLLALASSALVGSWELKVDEQDDSVKKFINDNNDRELTPNELSDLMVKFGREIGSLMEENIEKILENEKRGKPTGADDEQGLARIQRAKEIVARDAENRIAAAGKASTGELAEFSLSDAYASGKEFYLNKVNTRLQQAGSYIGSQLSSVANLAPKLKEKLQRAPKALKRMLSWPTFLRFKVKFNKVYKSRMEELYHQMVFLKTQTVIAIHNMKFFFGKTRHLQKATQYADITDEEYLNSTGNDRALADQLDVNKQDKLSAGQMSKLRDLQDRGMNIFGGNMSSLLARSKETSPNEIAAKKRASKRVELSRRKRDSSELDEDEEEGPMFMLASQQGEDEEDEDEDEDEHVGRDNEGGNEEAAEVDEFVTGFQTVDLEAQMDAELEEGDSSEEDEASRLERELEALDKEEFAPIDWSQHRCMPIIENQENCGFCYALVASTLTSFYICMWNLRNDPNSRPQRLSGRFTSDCGRYLFQPNERLLINGCNGGIIGQAVKFIREAGTMSFFGYDLQRVAARVEFHDDTCVLPRPPAIKDWAPIKAEFMQDLVLVGVERNDWASVNLFLHSVGPVIVNLRPWRGFKDYAGGVFDEIQMLPSEGKVHSMLIVGRDRDQQGRVYYKLRNTHGTTWGERGYGRISARALRNYSTVKGILMPVDDTNT